MVITCWHVEGPDCTHRLAGTIAVALLFSHNVTDNPQNSS